MRSRCLIEKMRKKEGREGFSCGILYWWKFLEGHFDVEAATLVVGE